MRLNVNELTGIFLTVVTYGLGMRIKKKWNFAICNPLLIAIILGVATLGIFHISYESFMKSGQFINMLIGPATAVVGLSIYRQRHVLKEFMVPILIGSAVSSICSLGSAWFISNIFALERHVQLSILPKSITTAIALDISAQLGGTESITLMAVVTAGVLGPVINSFLIQLLHLKDPVAVGVAMGSTSHAAGTAKAMEIGKMEGAVSGVCIGTTAVFTSLLVSLLLT